MRGTVLEGRRLQLKMCCYWAGEEIWTSAFLPPVPRGDGERNPYRERAIAVFERLRR